MSTPSFTLARTGDKIPAIAFGSGTKHQKKKKGDPVLKDSVDESLVDIIKFALTEGKFTHLDTAEVYTTRIEVGKAIAESGVPRNKLWITDKWNQGWGGRHRSTTPSGPYESLVKGLELMKIDYVDLFLIHAPFFGEDANEVTVEEAWRQMERLVDEGKARNIGVSNFDVPVLQKILAFCKYKPQVNQIEYNPYLQEQSPGIVEFCKRNEILVEAFSPLTPIVPTKVTEGPLDPVLKELESKYGVTNTLLLLRWVYQTGILPITTSTNKERLKDITKVWEFELEPSDVEKISAAGKKFHYRGFFQDYFEKYDQAR
ncbi:hypothetical protein KL918_000102 [Ogataea parapolymorpha]|uniref:2-dehydropantolactone reductase n=1 Tax=Ogataea parapolymorpha (strain ATCC 26012 / BCRC 20466 / JCM 22074 / NRRL Y-7560 / DL-1) TaxID=871575 RepID=W1Q762_OGAPD|nr:NADPH-dependent alpha-keto amide reductase [Ogataea parapolymorpha DL-1]ESW96154.1 NADPH-dependent alpha-keto amide reductase [Ogataea parapolymorpha DL-1]KAG7869898.1 hypothetical protein KL918_000102 [Ogataea parapolymorpha]KAG7873186.1 hypothetical protein KL916_002487 [Ogataea parapolymorpha]